MSKPQVVYRFALGKKVTDDQLTRINQKSVDGLWDARRQLRTALDDWIAVIEQKGLNSPEAGACGRKVATLRAAVAHEEDLILSHAIRNVTDEMVASVRPRGWRRFVAAIRLFAACAFGGTR